jgi:hypothetical protein
MRIDPREIDILPVVPGPGKRRAETGDRDALPARANGS